MENYILSYYQGIKDGSVVVGKWVRLLYERIIEDLETKETYFNQKEADKAVEWIESHCFHTEGALAPSPLKLELWQKAFVSSVFGIYDTETKKRRYREVMLVVARKNGKSLLAASIAKYIWMLAGGFGSRVFCIAPKLEQASIVYDNVWMMTTLDEDWQNLREAINNSRDEHNKKQMDDSMLAKRRQSDLFISGTNSMVKKLAYSARRSDGFSPQLSCLDEIAAWQGEKGIRQYEVMKSAMGAREVGDNPALLLACTTAGYENDGIYDELMKRATRYLLGDSNEKRFLPVLYQIDDIEKWNDINELRKSNPNLGVSLTVDYLLEEVAIAEGSLSRRAEFICKMCNIKQNASTAWLSSQVVENACGDPVRPEDLAHSYCVAGIDLSQARDLTSACVVVEKDGRLNILSHFWLPAGKIDDATARDGVPYNAYIQRGFLSLSGDNFIDYHDVYDWLVNLVEEYEILPLMVGYDRYSADYLTQDLNHYGFRTDSVYQGENLYGVMSEFQGLLEDGVINIGDNDLLKMHFLDSAIKMNAERGRGRLVKVNQSRHIDGMAAVLDAMTVRQKWHEQIGDQLKNEE